MPDDSRWKTIDSAPKDGTKILVWTHHDEIELTHWYELQHDVYEEVEGGLFRKTRRTYACGWNGNTPTHWQPLPDPPGMTGSVSEEGLSPSTETGLPSDGR